MAKRAWAFQPQPHASASLRLHHSKEPEWPDHLFSLDTSNLVFQGKTQFLNVDANLNLLMKHSERSFPSHFYMELSIWPSQARLMLPPCSGRWVPHCLFSFSPTPPLYISCRLVPSSCTAFIFYSLAVFVQPVFSSQNILHPLSCQKYPFRTSSGLPWWLWW